MSRARRRHLWAGAILAAVAASTWRAGIGGDLVNTGGWSSFVDFWAGITEPELSTEFLELVGRATLTTLSFAVLGTMLSVVIGIAFGPVLSERVWTTETRLGPARRRARAIGRQFVNLGGIVPRALHEVIWALLLAQVYGTAPIVAVLAIGIPFGATTAAVFADTLDEADGRGFDRLRADGAGRLRALTYGLLPNVSGDLISYGFYRFECSVRSAAILGIIGAGGLGYEIDLSFQTLRYGEMWTMIAALVVLSAAADSVSSWVRRRRVPALPGRCADVRLSPVDATAGAAEPRADDTSHAIVGGALADVPFTHRAPTRLGGGRLAAATGGVVAAAVACWWYADVDASILWEPRRRELFGRLIGDMFPPRLPPGGFSELASASIDTVAMAILAIAISSVAGFVVAMMSMRRTDLHTRRGVGGTLAAAAHLIRTWALRLVMLVFRAVPPPVWAFVAVLVLFPGMWPGVAALAAYNTGVLSRLFAETLEEMNPGPINALAASGARRTVQLWYGAVPLVARRFIALSAYRWEVLTRETVIVGVVGAAGLGRLIQDEFVSRDFAAVTSSMMALVVLIMAASAITRGVRATLR